MHGIRGASSDTGIHGRDAEAPSGDVGEAADSVPAEPVNARPAWPRGAKRVHQRVERCIQAVTRPSSGSVVYRVFVGTKYVGTYDTIPEAREARDAVKAERAPKPSARKLKRSSSTAWIRESASHVRLVVASDIDTHEVRRPKHRGECEGGIRPCPWYSCSQHLGMDVIDGNGAIRYHDPERLDEMTDTCALDVADRGAHTLEEVGDIYGVTRERIRQIESWGLRGMQRALRPWEAHLEQIMREREGSDGDGE